jgi:hypothetical protein
MKRVVVCHDSEIQYCRTDIHGTTEKLVLHDH